MGTAQNPQRLFGARMRRYRKQAGLTLKQIAAQVGKTETSMSRVEQGKQNVSLGDIVAIAAALHVEVYQLFVPDDPPGWHGRTKPALHLVFANHTVIAVDTHEAAAQAEPLHSFLFPRAWRIPAWPVRLALPPCRPALAYAG